MADKNRPKRAHVHLSGKVQGVGLRAYVRSHALLLRIKGFVKNLQDGRVEIVAEGTEEQLQELTKKLKQGDYANYIETVEFTWETHTGKFLSFDIEF